MWNYDSLTIFIILCFPTKNIGQYNNKSVISGTLFFYNLWYLINCNRSSFITMYLLLFKTEMDFHNRHKKIMFLKNNWFITILADFRNHRWKLAIEVDYLKMIPFSNSTCKKTWQTFSSCFCSQTVSFLNLYWIIYAINSQIIKHRQTIYHNNYNNYCKLCKIAKI